MLSLFLLMTSLIATSVRSKECPAFSPNPALCSRLDRLDARLSSATGRLENMTADIKNLEDLEEEMERLRSQMDWLTKELDECRDRGLRTPQGREINEMESQPIPTRMKFTIRMHENDASNQEEEATSSEVQLSGIAEVKFNGTVLDIWMTNASIESLVEPQIRFLTQELRNLSESLIDETSQNMNEATNCSDELAQCHASLQNHCEVVTNRNTTVEEVSDQPSHGVWSQWSQWRCRFTPMRTRQCLGPGKCIGSKRQIGSTLNISECRPVKKYAHTYLVHDRINSTSSPPKPPQVQLPPES